MLKKKYKQVEKNIKKAIIVTCSDINSDKQYIRVSWNVPLDTPMEDYVYVNGNQAISLLNGKEYPILSHQITERKRGKLRNVEIGKNYVVNLESARQEELSIIQRQVLTKEALAIQERIANQMSLEEQNSNQKTYKL